MQRINSLNLQFAAQPVRSVAPATRPKGNFNDTWSYLNMDQFLSKEGIEYKKKCEEFMDEINPTVRLKE